MHFDKLSIVFVIALSFVFLHEPMSWQTVVGGGLILGGAVVLML
jgi:transporter family protein